MATPGWKAVVGGSEYEIVEIDIQQQINALDSVVFTTTHEFGVEDAVTIQYLGHTIGNYFVKDCDRITQKYYQTEAVELAYDLQRILMTTAGGSHVVDLLNPSEDETIGDYVASIIYGSGWTDGSDSAYKNRTTLPTSENPLPDMRFTNTYIMEGLNRFIMKMCLYMVWFNDSSKTLYYGESREDKTSTTVPSFQVNRKRTNKQYGITEVYVIGKDTTVMGHAIKDGASPPYKTLQYQEYDYTDANQLQEHAESILQEHQSTQNDRYELLLPKNYYNYHIGDLVKYLDSLASYSGTGAIKDIHWTAEGVTIGVGNKETTIFDVMGEKLKLISGISAVGSDMAWDGGWQNVGSATDAVWHLTFTDISKLGSFHLSVLIDKFKKFMSSDQAMTGISGTEDGETNIPGADGATAAIFNTGDPANIIVNNNSTGLETMNSPTCATATLEDVPIVSGDTSWNWASDTLTGGSWNDVGSYFLSSIRYSVMFCVRIRIRDQHGTAGDRGYSVRIARYVEGVAYPARAICNFATYAESSDCYYDLVCSGVCEGGWVGDELRIQINPAQSDTTLLGWGFDITGFDEHEHGLVEGLGHYHDTDEDPHGHANEDYGHEHASYDEGHSHPITDPKHPHDVTDKNHTHNENDDLTEVNSFATQIEISVNGTVVASDAGGSQKTIDCGDVTDHLVTGQNAIVVHSHTAGAAFPMAEYIVYGDVS